jgi:hypothetical protein
MKRTYRLIRIWHFFAFSLCNTLSVEAEKLELKPDADLREKLRPNVANRAFNFSVNIEQAGDQGVLMAQGGDKNGWSFYIANKQLHFILNHDGRSEHIETSELPELFKFKKFSVSLDIKRCVRIFGDEQELTSGVISSMLPLLPVDGFQVGRDLTIAVGKYTIPYPFNGKIASATLEIGAEAERPLFVGSVPTGGPVPKIDAKEQENHPFPERDRFGGHLGTQLKATGYFRTEQVKGRWVFVTPEGHPFIAIGTNHTGLTIRDQGRNNGLWARFDNSPDVTAEKMLPIIQGMGFTAGDVYQQESTYTRTLPWISFFWYGDSNNSFIDVFDPVRLQDVEYRAYEHAKSLAYNPWVLGIAGPDLNAWDNRLIRKYRRLPPIAPGRARYVDFVKERYTGSISKFNQVYQTKYQSFDDMRKEKEILFPIDIESDRRFEEEAAKDPNFKHWRSIPQLPAKSANPAMQADNDAFAVLIVNTLFPRLKKAINRAAPNHLFMGEHLGVRLVPDAVIKAMGPHIDVYLAEAVEVSEHRPPDWQLFQKNRWDQEHKLTGNKPIIIADWVSPFSYGPAFENRGYTIKPEKESTDDAARFLEDAFATDYIIGLFVCKLCGGYGNDENYFQKRCTRTYLKPDATPYPYRTERIKKLPFPRR